MVATATDLDRLTSELAEVIGRHRVTLLGPRPDDLKPATLHADVAPALRALAAEVGTDRALELAVALYVEEPEGGALP